MPRKKQVEAPQKKLGWVNKKEVCASLSISPQAFDRWGVEPICKIGRETFYTFENVLINRQEKWEQEQVQHNNLGALLDPAELEYQRFRKTKAEADKIELGNVIEKREFAPVDLLEWALANLAEQVASTLDAIPATIKNHVPHLKASDLSIIEREITKCRNTAADVKLPWDQLSKSD